MLMRLLLASTVAAGLALAPAALARDAVKSAPSKQKTPRAAKAHKTTRDMSGPTGQMKPNGHPYGEPYTMQKDEMTR
jgi:hypothetical protein